MARFFIAHRLAGKRSRASQEQSREAAEKALAGMREFAHTRTRPPSAAKGWRHVVMVEADAHEMKAKAPSLPSDVIVEPEMTRVPARILHSVPVPDASAMPAGRGDTFKLTLQCDGAALAGATIALSLMNHQTLASVAVQGHTDDDGIAKLPYDAGFWSPSTVIVMPANAAWSWMAPVAGPEIALSLPPLPRNGPLGWWHYALNSRTYHEKSGAGISIGVADTGLGQHPYLVHAHNIGAFVNGSHDPAAGSGLDVGDHGTHVAGIIGARPPAHSGDFAGIAAGADLYCARVYPSSTESGLTAQATTASNGDVAIAIDALVNEHKVDLINLSLGGFQPSQLELDAIQGAIEAGALVICSAGNESGGPVTYPAAYAQTIGVSAIGFPGCCPGGGLDAATTPIQGDRYSYTGAYSPTFTSVGPTINCVGPGVGVISTVPGSKDGSAPYAAMSGTSMAAPAVCAALAVRLSADKAYRAMPRDVQRAMHAAAVLLQSSTDLGLAARYQGLGLPSM
jgi:subtilisin family serine protease